MRPEALERVFVVAPEAQLPRLSRRCRPSSSCLPSHRRHRICRQGYFEKTAAAQHHNIARSRLIRHHEHVLATGILKCNLSDIQIACVRVDSPSSALKVGRVVAQSPVLPVALQFSRLRIQRYSAADLVGSDLGIAVLIQQQIPQCDVAGAIRAMEAAQVAHPPTRSFFNSLDHSVK